MIKSHLFYYLKLPSEFFFGVPLYKLFYLASIPLAVAGAFRRCGSDYPAMIYIALTLLLYIPWPDIQGIRFLFPILPFYLSLACSGLETFCGGATAVQERLRKGFCYVPVFFVILFFGLNTLRPIYWNSSSYGETEHGPFAPTSQEMFSFIRNHTESDCIIVFFKPRVMRLMTGRESIVEHRSEHVFRGDYLCLYSRVGEYRQVSHGEVERLLAQGVLQIVYVNDDFKVYRLSKVNEHIHNNALHTEGDSAALLSRR